MDAYFEAKRLLFTRQLKPGGHAVIKASDAETTNLVDWILSQ